MGNWTQNLYIYKQSFNSQRQIYFWNIWNIGFKTYLKVLHSSQTRMDEAVSNQNILISKFCIRRMFPQCYQFYIFTFQC